MKLAINKCPHGVYSISIDDDGGGMRLTPVRCCGRWEVVTSLREKVAELEKRLEPKSGNVADDAAEAF